MKKLIMLLFLVVPLFAQSIKDIDNSTNSSTVPLDSSEVYTGYRRDVTAYNSISISMWSDDTATVSVQFGDLVNTSFVIQKYFIFTYLTNDSTFTKVVPVVAPYYRVVVTNSATDSMTVFKLTSILHKGQAIPIDSSGYVEVTDQELIDSLASANTLLAEIRDTTANSNALLKTVRNNIATNTDTTANSNALLKSVRNNVSTNTDTTANSNTLLKSTRNAVEIMDDWDESDRAKTNPIVGQAGVSGNTGIIDATTQRITIATDDEVNNSLDVLDNAVDGNYLNVNVNMAGADATTNIGNADASTQRVVLASDQPSVAVTLSPTDTVTVKSIVNALPAGTNAIGKLAANDGVDIGDVTINNANGASAVNIQDGNNSITIDDGGVDLNVEVTETSFDATQATHDNLNSNANIQIGNVDVGVANPVPISDNSSSVTVDNGGTFAVQVNAALPAGSAIIGQIGIDQTTPGTTNKVDIGTNGTVAATQSGTWNTNTLDSARVVNTVNTITNTVTVDATGQGDVPVTLAGERVELTDGTENMMIDNGATYDGILVRLTDGTNLSSLSGTGDLEVSGDAGVALATESTVNSIKTAVEIIDNVVSGSEAQVDIVASLPAGDNNIGNVDIVDLPALTYGNTTLINASQLDDSPTADTSAAFLLGNKNKIGISINYDETEVGGGVSGTLTLQVSPDSSSWYAFDIILDGNGTDAPNASITLSADGTDYVYLPNFVTATYLRAIFTGTNTDVDDIIVVSVVLYWQAE